MNLSYYSNYDHIPQNYTVLYAFSNNYFIINGILININRPQTSWLRKFQNLHKQKCKQLLKLRAMHLRPGRRQHCYTGNSLFSASQSSFVVTWLLVFFFGIPPTIYFISLMFYCCWAQKKIAQNITTEQGKTLPDAEGDVMRGLRTCSPASPYRSDTY